MHARRFASGSTPQAGFTLMELLVTIAILLVVTLIVIPNLSSFRIQANENSAIASVRSIYLAEIDYRAKYPAQGFACSLGELGGNPRSAPPTRQQAELLPPSLADGRKSGYSFHITNCTAPQPGNPSRDFGFEITAVPQVLGKTGHRGFCEGITGAPKSDPAGGTHCTDSLE